MTQDTKIILGIGAITVVLIAVALFFLGNSGNSSKQANPSTPADLKLLIRDDSFKIATDSAKVTLVEFSDFECPACAAVEPEVQRILTDYKGKINFVYRHFPLPQHTKAIAASIAVEAAGQQGKFMEMGAKLFATQQDWVSADNTDQIFINDAKDLGLDTNKFSQDLKSPTLSDKVKRDYQDAISLKISSTPTFFINGEQMTGATYDTLKQKIDAAYSK